MRARVIDQDPPAGTEVSLGLEVALTLAEPPKRSIGCGLLGLMALAGGCLALLKLRRGPRKPGRSAGGADQPECRITGAVFFFATVAVAAVAFVVTILR